jgi:poly-gamma-glutamate synthesis protein (capsule biosynthesis protein)
MSTAPADPRRAERASKLLVVALVGIFLFGMLGFALAVIDSRDAEPGLPAAPSLPALDAIPAAAAEPATEAPRVLLALADADEGAPPAPTPLPTAVPTVSPLPEDPTALAADDAGPLAEPSDASAETVMPLVPVASFWSKRAGIRRGDLRSALESGRVKGFERVIVAEGIADALAAELGIELHADVRRGDIERVRRAVRRGALGVVPATSVGPSVRALEVNGTALTGVERIRDVADWPLTVRLPLPQSERWDQRDTWSLIAGGDAFTDRGVYDTVVRKGKGVDYPFDGGTARVTGYGCCDPVFNDNVVPRYRLTGNKGLVRRTFRRADLAIANHEQPVTDSAVFHSSGTRFSGKPNLTRIFSRAGIDYLSLANNHIGDYGADGITDTRRILRANDIAFGGAGKDLAQARVVRDLDVRGTDVAIIPCLDIVKIYWAEARKAGATPCLDRYLVPDIKQAKRRGAVVIVFPHWGVEYTRQPLPSMRRHAARWVKAGADMVLGAHSHVAGAMEDIGGTPVLYSLGNLIFDQHWSTDTMMSALLEATFHGDALVELRLRPYIIHDTSQPNFLDPDSGEGRRLLQQIRSASRSWLDW